MSDHEREGITGETVTGTVVAAIKYPCVVIRSSAQVSESAVLLMKRLMTPLETKVIPGREIAPTVVQDISIYLQRSGSSLSLLGAVDENGFGTILTLIDEDSLVGYLDEATPLEGINLLVLRG